MYTVQNLVQRDYSNATDFEFDTGDKAWPKWQTLTQVTSLDTSDKPWHRWQALTQVTNLDTGDKPWHRWQTLTLTSPREQADPGDRPCHDHNKIAPCGMIKNFWIETLTPHHLGNRPWPSHRSKDRVNHNITQVGDCDPHVIWVTDLDPHIRQVTDIDPHIIQVTDLEAHMTSVDSYVLFCVQILPGMSCEEASVRNLAVKAIGMCCQLERDIIQFHLPVLMQVTKISPLPICILCLDRLCMRTDCVCVC